MIFPFVSLHIHPAISFLCCFLLTAAEQWASIKIILVCKCSKKLKNLLPIFALGMLKVKVLVTWLCLTLCDSMVFHGTPGRTLEWVAISYYRGSSWSRNGIRVSCIAGRFFTVWATEQAQPYVYYLKANSLIRKITHINLFSTIRALLWIEMELCN